MLKGVGRQGNASLETREWLPWKPQAESSAAGRLRERSSNRRREKECVCDEKIKRQCPRGGKTETEKDHETELEEEEGGGNLTTFLKKRGRDNNTDSYGQTR